MIRIWSRRLVWGLVGSLLLVLVVRAQGTLGGINGTVTDSSSAVMHAVTVAARNVATNLKLSKSTSNDGSFSFVDLPVGIYEVTFTKDGFKTVVYSQILVEVGRITTVNASLQPGEVTASVTVTGTSLLNETTTANGYTLDSQLIENVPLGTGSFTQLALLSPGLSADLLSGSGVNAGLGNQDIFANGQRDTSNSFSFNSVTAINLFNGLSSSSVGESRFVLNTNEQFLAGGQVQTNTSVFDAVGQGLPTPPTETIQEINVNASEYDVSQGANSGAHVGVLTKSGTNDFHGGIYEYHQSTGLTANTFFFNAAGLPREPLHRNVFGATLGGPILKNKLFFFGSYQGQRVTDATNGGTEVVNSPCQNQASASNPVASNCLGADRSAATLASIASVPNCGATGNPACLTAAQVDPVALQLLQAKLPNGQFLFPSVTQTSFLAIQALGGNAVINGPASAFNADQVNGNLDYVFNTKDRIAGKYYFQNDPSTSPFAISQVQGFAQRLQAGSQVFSIDNTTVLTTNTTWEQKIGFVRQIANARVQQPFTPSAEGINLFGSQLFPGIDIRNDDSGTRGGLKIGPTNNFANAGVFQNNFEVGTSYNWQHGRHSVSFGFDGAYSQLNVLNRENQVASLGFNTFATFLTGTLRGGTASEFLNGETNRYYRAKQTGLFVQDSYKLLPNLTITAGLRWDWDGPLYEKNGLLTNFVPQDYSFDLNTDTVNNIGLVVAGNNKQFCQTQASFCTSDSTLTGRQWLFQPRIGIAWSPKFVKHLVLRAGYGLYADRGEFFTELSPSAGGGISGPFGVTTEQPFTLVQQSTCKGPMCIAAPFGGTPPAPPPGNFAGIAALVPNLAGLSGCTEPVTPTCAPVNNSATPFTFGGYNPANTLPYSENWTFDLQWQPFNSWLFDVGYVGNHSQHLLVPVPFNESGIATPTHNINGQASSYGFQATDANGGNGVLLTEQVNTFDGGNTDLRAPFVGYNPNSNFWNAAGISNYSALQVSARKTISHGLMINAAYTFSHTLDEGSGLSEGLFFNGNDPLNLRSAYGNAAFDRTHVFTVSYLYQLPDLAKSHRWLGYAVNGWGISGITTAESGLPYSAVDFSGSVASQFFSSNDFITNPILATPGNSIQSVQVNNGLQKLNGAAFGVLVNAPGTNGVPACGPTTDNPSPTAACDFSETAFSGGPRDPFRGPFQVNFDTGIFKNFKFKEHYTLRFDAQFFNLFNHANFDAPNANFSLDGCFGPNIQTSPSQGCAWDGTIPGVAGSGTIGSGKVPTGLGVIQNTIGTPRLIQFALHLNF
jgi:Carboxypeptidase regulatory-like domain/TonB dependent receptor